MRGHGDEAWTQPPLCVNSGGLGGRTLKGLGSACGSDIEGDSGPEAVCTTQMGASSVQRPWVHSGGSASHRVVETRGRGHGPRVLMGWREGCTEIDW